MRRELWLGVVLLVGIGAFALVRSTGDSVALVASGSHVFVPTPWPFPSPLPTLAPLPTTTRAPTPTARQQIVNELNGQISLAIALWLDDEVVALDVPQREELLNYYVRPLGADGAAPLVRDRWRRHMAVFVSGGKAPVLREYLNFIGTRTPDRAPQGLGADAMMKAFADATLQPQYLRDPQLQQRFADYKAPRP